MSCDPSTQNTIDLSQSEVVWNALTEILDRFVEAWEQAPPTPILDKFLPSKDQPYRALALIELLKIDLESRAKCALELAPLESLASRWPDLLGDDLPADLIYEDYQIRRRHSQSVDLNDYAKRFPSAAEALNRMIGGNDAGASTSMIAKHRIANFEPGQKIDDFDLLVQLGKGSFATVFLARQNSMQRLVALKISADHGVEPQTLAQLDHPNIVRVYDQRQVAGQPIRLMYMQYLAGGTLKEALDVLAKEPRDQWSGQRFLQIVDQQVTGRGEEPVLSSEYRKRLEALTWPEAICKIGEQLANALEYAHGREVLHRDIKPANVMLSSEAITKLVDFNVSFSGEVEGASPATFFGGSVVYMSPEQLEACDPHHDRKPSELDGRTDVYSLGVVLYELLTGERPFGAEYVDSNWRTTVGEMIARRREGIPRHRLERMEEDFDNVPELLTDAITRCLSAKAEHRFDSAGALARQLHWATQPSANQLLKTPRFMLRPKVSYLASLIVIALLILPNALAAIFVYAYNGIESVPETLRPVFWKTQSVINGIAFPFATILILYAILPVAAAVRRLGKLHSPQLPTIECIESTQPHSFADLAAPARRTNTLLGHWGACVCFPIWVIAGFLYPIVLSQQSMPLPSNAWFDFIGSHFLAGIISASYVFFGITFFCLRAWQPQLLRASITIPACELERDNLRRLGRLVPFYQFLSAVIPFLAISLLVIWGEARNRTALSILSVTSLLGMILLFWISKRLQSNVAALQQMASPREAGL